jgi:hypothetical protein
MGAGPPKEDVHRGVKKCILCRNNMAKGTSSIIFFIIIADFFIMFDSLSYLKKLKIIRYFVIVYFIIK